MNMAQVDSAGLSAVGYDSHRRLLLVHFRDASIYRYFEVPSFVYHELLTSDSKGAYFNRFVRSVFGCERITVAD